MEIKDKISIASSIITILAFGFSIFIFWKQRKELINQNKTQELRNEMYALFNLIEYHTFWDLEDVKLFCNLLDKLNKHNNAGLLIECKLHKVSLAFLYSFKEKTEYKKYIEILSKN
jgi:hypothetical protein